MYNDRGTQNVGNMDNVHSGENLTVQDWLQ